MLITDADIIGQLERIGSHYRLNIATQFIRPALLQLPLDKQTWDHLDTFMYKFEEIWHYGIALDELYRTILAAAHFVTVCRRGLTSVLRNRLIKGQNANPDKVLRDMAVNNIPSNIEVFAGMIKRLYESAVEIDKAQAKRSQPLYLSVPEFREIGSMLGIEDAAS